uniref:Fam-b protein n=1 Tax=Meloidogyne hapla TaxID=6305 RepID=A0A1I8B9A5_MELHA
MFLKNLLFLLFYFFPFCITTNKDETSISKGKEVENNQNQSEYEKQIEELSELNDLIYSNDIKTEEINFGWDYNDCFLDNYDEFYLKQSLEKNFGK